MIVHTATGEVRGGAESGLFAFRGIPFAAPPSGERRFQPPSPPAPWTGVRDCREFSAIPPQPELSLDSPVKVRQEQSEDCLYLNIYTPADGDGGYPVLFWIFGGGFIAGTANMPLYDAPRLAAENGVIVVTFNYRIGLPGFLGDGNFGLQDQFAALQWVRENIAAFGGDPDNITLFGESAGAISVDLFMRNPRAKGMFRRAICQSGAMDSLRSFAVGRPELRENALAAAARLQGDLPTLPVQQLLEQQSKFFGWDDPAKYVCTPVYDGLWCAHDYCNPVPLITGTNTNEETVFTNQADPAGFERWCSAVYNKVIANRIRKRYHDPEDPNAPWNAVIRYGAFTAPARRLAETVSRSGQPVYLYHFNRLAPEVQFAKRLKCYHASEISYIFGTPLTAPPPEDVELSRRMRRYWANFARTGDPNGDSLPSWPQYSSRDRRNIVFDVPIGTERDYAAADCDFFDEIH
jgi:para-nitrobenzyl esterase